MFSHLPQRGGTGLRELTLRLDGRRARQTGDKVVDMLSRTPAGRCAP